MQIDTYPESPTPGEYGFDAIRPQHGGPWETFSIGVGKWKKLKNGNMGREKATVRVGGRSDNPEPVFALARKIADQLTAGTYAGPKVIHAKPDGAGG